MRTNREREREHTQRTRGANQKEIALKEHTKNKRGKPKRDRTQRTRGANLGVVEVQSRAHVKIWCAHK